MMGSMIVDGTWFKLMRWQISGPWQFPFLNMGVILLLFQSLKSDCSLPESSEILNKTPSGAQKTEATSCLMEYPGVMTLCLGH